MLIKEKEMVRRDIFNLFGAVNGVLDVCEKKSNDPNEKEKVPVKLTYVLLRDKSILQPDIEIMSKAVIFKGDASKLQEFDTKRRETLTKYSRKDDDGNPIIVNNGFEIEMVNVAKANEELNVLINEYSEVLEQKRVFDEEVNSFLSGKALVSVYTIDVDWLIDGISPSQLEGLMPILEGEEELGN